MLTNAETALLGLLSEQAMYPYQIEKEVKFRDMRFWTELSMSSIYKLLRKLEKEGMVECEKKISDENRLRKQYRLTEQGESELQANLVRLLTEPEHIRWQFDIGIYNSNLIPVDEVRNALTRYRAKLAENLQGYHELELFMKDLGCSPQQAAVSIRPRYLIQAEMDWIDDYLKTLRTNTQPAKRPNGK